MKRLIIIVLVMACLFISPLFTDPNGDGHINAIDCAMVNWHLLGKRIMTPAEQYRSDVNRDGLVNQTDIDLMTDIIIRR